MQQVAPSTSEGLRIFQSNEIEMFFGPRNPVDMPRLTFPG